MEVGGEWVEKKTGESNTGGAETVESGKTIYQNNNIPHVDNSSCLHPQRKRKQVP